jgi:hypothetical protein
MVSLLAATLILPGWLWARRLHPQSFWLFLLPLGGVALWIIIIALDIGPQSLANVIEIFGVAGSAVMAAYLKFFVFDRHERLRPQGIVVAVAIVVIVTLGLRLFMPVLPE